jgi:hypothetical protein
MEHITISLYVLNKGNGQFMVSKININGYVKYTKTGDGCWTMEGGDNEEEVKTNDVKTSEGVSDNEVVNEVETSDVKTSKGSSQVVNETSQGSSQVNETSESDSEEEVNKQYNKLEVDHITTQKCGGALVYTNANFKTRMTELLTNGKGFTSVKDDNRSVYDFTLELLQHIDIRFSHLDCLLKRNKSLNVVIAGGNGRHNLGSGFAVGQWGLSSSAHDDGTPKFNNNYEKTQEGKYYNLVQEVITGWCRMLMDKYNTNSQRVSYGLVGVEHGMGNTNIHVWGANINNFKNSNLGGGGQATDVKDGSEIGNAAGAFGIITTPLDIDWNTTFTQANSPFKNAELIKESFTHIKGGNKSKQTKKRRNKY